MAEVAGVFLEVWPVCDGVVVVEFVAVWRGAGIGVVVDALVAEPAVCLRSVCRVGVEAFAFFVEGITKLLEAAAVDPVSGHCHPRGSGV